MGESSDKRKTRELIFKGIKQPEPPGRESLIEERKKRHEIRPMPGVSYGANTAGLTVSEGVFIEKAPETPQQSQSSTKIKTTDKHRLEIDKTLSFNQFLKDEPGKAKTRKLGALGNFLRLTYEGTGSKSKRRLNRNTLKTQSAQNFSIKDSESNRSPVDKSLKHLVTQKSSRPDNQLQLKLKPRVQRSRMKKAGKRRKKLDLSVSFEVKTMNKSMHVLSAKATKKIKSSKSNFKLPKRPKQSASRKRAKKLKPLVGKSGSKRKGKGKSKSKNKAGQSRTAKTKGLSQRKKKIVSKNATPRKVLNTQRPRRHKEARYGNGRRDNHFDKLTRLYRNRKSKNANQLKVLKKSPNARAAKGAKTAEKASRGAGKLYKKPRLKKVASRRSKSFVQDSRSTPKKGKSSKSRK